ncbi:MAG: DUF2093 domain-containing protein, partial [Caulobacteraceae bacterium]
SSTGQARRSPRPRAGQPVLRRTGEEIGNAVPRRYVGSMNAHDRSFPGREPGLAVVRYGEGDLTVIAPGRHVVCAVSGRRIPLHALRYWNADLQEAYAGPAEALARWKALNAAS